jgi:hypothetical protein
MAGYAIRVANTSFGWIGCCFFSISSLVLMVMMAEVPGRCASFMLAIHAHCRPTELQWEQCQQKDDGPATHAGYSSGFVADFKLASKVASGPM